MENNIELYIKGIQCLFKELGDVNAERFIYLLKKENFDYTKWRESALCNLSLDEVLNGAKQYCTN